MKNKNWILVLMMMLFMSATMYQQNVYNYKILARAGISIGDDSPSGTEVTLIDSITYDGTYAYLWIAGDTIPLYVPIAFLDNIGDIAVLLETPPDIKSASAIAALGDQKEIIVMNVGTANTFTIQQFSSVALPVGTFLTLYNTGAGTCTLTEGASVTITSPGSLFDIPEEGWATVYHWSTNNWAATGGLE